MEKSRDARIMNNEEDELDMFYAMDILQAK